MNNSEAINSLEDWKKSANYKRASRKNIRENHVCGQCRYCWMVSDYHNSEGIDDEGEPLPRVYEVCRRVNFDTGLPIVFELDDDNNYSDEHICAQFHWRSSPRLTIHADGTKTVHHIPYNDEMVEVSYSVIE